MSTLRVQFLKDNTTGKSVDASFITDGTAKNWTNLAVTGGVPSLADSLNASSVTDNAVGHWTVNLTTYMANANYARADGGGANEYVQGANATGSYDVYSYNSAWSTADYTPNHSIVMGDLS